MSKSDIEIVVEDPDAPDAGSPSVTSTRVVEVVTLILLLGLSILFAYDNWRTGIAWASDGPEAGYFPFYLSIIMGAACLYGLGREVVKHAEPSESFVTWAQLRRVMQVFVPTLLFILCVQWLGLYVGSFLLVAGFMWQIGRIALWKSVLTSFIFAMLMFLTFQIAFDVIMPKGPLEAAFGF